MIADVYAKLVAKWVPLMKGYAVSIDEQVSLLNTILVVPPLVQKVTCSTASLRFFSPP